MLIMIYYLITMDVDVCVVLYTYFVIYRITRDNW